MIHRLFRRLFRLALVIGTAAAVYKVVQARRPSPDLPQGDAWPPTPRGAPKPQVPEPQATRPPVAKATAATPKQAPATKKAPVAKKAATNGDGAGWVEPVNGACPAAYPVKGKLKSLIYHLPGMTAYQRTNPDRCYRDEASAQADGLRKAKR
ncbi:MAG: hypothetical protein M3159_04105 [Actinomycetota bacterium]|nr:hypothetical protein [Actinomycetota bacterium]